MTKDDITTAAAKVAPPSAVVAWQKVTDLTLNDWVMIATLAYIALQAFVLIRKEFWKRKK